MTKMSALERRYRRLLAWYPAQHRHAHGEEMIGVLLASAQDGQRRPRLPDALDLALGGLRIRARAALAGRFGPGVTDALAVYSRAIPVMWMLILLAWGAAIAWGMLRSGAPGAFALAAPIVPLLLCAAFPLALAWRGRRAAAVAVALLPAALFTCVAFWAPSSGLASADSLFAVLQVVALAASPGPRRGARVMTRWTWGVVCAAGLAGAIPLYAIIFGWMSGGAGALAFAAVALTAAAGLLLTMPKPVAARLIAMLTAPVYLSGLAILTADQFIAGPSGLDIASFAIVYVPALVLAVLIAVLGRAGPRRRLGQTG
ncbi:MAG TPA: hypothetical protein VFW16_01625 [Streptosporangiaceae bacterium]|nr:hypothetical protein [Streptosporangiaceae bacterium]